MRSEKLHALNSLLLKRRCHEHSFFFLLRRSNFAFYFHPGSTLLATTSWGHLDDLEFVYNLIELLHIKIHNCCLSIIVARRLLHSKINLVLLDKTILLSWARKESFDRIRGLDCQEILLELSCPPWKRSIIWHGLKPHIWAHEGVLVDPSIRCLFL